jgi:hypothetical protein
MNTEITKITPEGFDVANAFLMYGDVRTTAEQIQVPVHEIVKILQTPEVKRYLDGVYLDQGYRNRDKIGKIMDKMIESKLEEAEESGVYSSKDLLELLQAAHKMRMDEIKMAKEASNVPGVAVQVNNQFGDSNYGRLMSKLVGDA